MRYAAVEIAWFAFFVENSCRHFSRVEPDLTMRLRNSRNAIKLVSAASTKNEGKQMPSPLIIGNERLLLQHNRSFLSQFRRNVHRVATADELVETKCEYGAICFGMMALKTGQKHSLDGLNTLFRRQVCQSGKLLRRTMFTGYTDGLFTNQRTVSPFRLNAEGRFDP